MKLEIIPFRTWLKGFSSDFKEEEYITRYQQFIKKHMPVQYSQEIKRESKIRGSLEYERG